MSTYYTEHRYWFVQGIRLIVPDYQVEWAVEKAIITESTTCTASNETHYQRGQILTIIEYSENCIQGHLYKSNLS